MAKPDCPNIGAALINSIQFGGGSSARDFAVVADERVELGDGVEDGVGAFDPERVSAGFFSQMSSIGVGAEEDAADAGAARVAADLAEQFYAVHARQAVIGDDGMGTDRIKSLDGVFAGSDEFHGVAMHFQQLTHDIADVGVIVN